MSHSVPLRAIIVDDEPLARERVKTLLREHPDVEVVDECANAAQAIVAIHTRVPDLAFIDVQMPDRARAASPVRSSPASARR